MLLKRLLPTVAVISFLLGALAVALVAGPLWHIGNLAPAAAKSTGTPTKPGAARAQAACDAFLKDFAAQLGVPQDKVKASLKTSIKDAIDRAVKQGDLTPDQATRAKARVDAVNGCDTLPAFGKHFGRHFGGGHPGGFEGGRRGLDGIVNAAASALAVTPADLRTAIMSGKTLHEVAGTRTSKADFDTAFRAALTKELQPQVDAGKVTAEMAKVRVDHAVAAADSLWDSSLRDAVGGFFGHQQGAGKVPPGAASTTQ